MGAISITALAGGLALALAACTDSETDVNRDGEPDLVVEFPSRR